MFSEVPMLLVGGYLGLKYIPDTWTVIFEHALLYTCPIFIVLEGFSAMTVILSSGQLWSESLAAQPNVVKGVIAAGCLALYLCSAGVIVHFYVDGMIRTVVGASMVAIVVTLLVILTVGTIIADHGTITDSSLLTLYLTYNIWIVARSVPSITLHSQGTLLLKLISQASFRTISSFPLAPLLSSLISVFSVEIVTTLIVQMALFLTAITLYRKALVREEEEGADDQFNGTSFAVWLVSVVWPCFGKCGLVAVYAYSWLSALGRDELPLYLDPVLWRWLNIFLCIILYVYHLLHDPSHDDYHLHSD